MGGSRVVGNLGRSAEYEVCGLLKVAGQHPYGVTCHLTSGATT